MRIVFVRYFYFLFFRDELRLKSKNVLYPPNLYKGMVWMEGGNDKLFYAGVQVHNCQDYILHYDISINVAL